MLLVDALEKKVEVGIEMADGKMVLKKNHAYWYQIQTQMFCTGLKYAHFVCWSPKDIFIESIECDEYFMSSRINHLKTYFVKLVLPELMAKHYTRPVASATAKELLYCYCRTEEDEGLDIVCGSDFCLYRRFHLKCIGLKRMPSANKIWLCKQCRKLQTN